MLIHFTFSTFCYRVLQRLSSLDMRLEMFAGLNTFTPVSSQSPYALLSAQGLCTVRSSVASQLWARKAASATSFGLVRNPALLRSSTSQIYVTFNGNR